MDFSWAELDVIERVNQTPVVRVDLDRWVWKTEDGRKRVEAWLAAHALPGSTDRLWPQYTLNLESGAITSRPGIHLLPPDAIVPLEGRERVTLPLPVETYHCLLDSGKKGVALALHALDTRVSVWRHLSLELAEDEELVGEPAPEFRNLVQKAGFLALYGVSHDTRHPDVDGVLRRLIRRRPHLLVRGNNAHRLEVIRTRRLAGIRTGLKLAMEAEAGGCVVRGFWRGQPLLDSPSCPTKGELEKVTAHLDGFLRTQLLEQALATVLLGKPPWDVP